MGGQGVKNAVYAMLLACALLFGAHGARLALAAPEKKINELIDEADRHSEKLPAKAGLIQRPVLEYSSEGMRDPFLNYLPEKEMTQAKGMDVDGFTAKLRALRVEGIIWGSSMPQAIVNNRVIKAGDQLEGASVTGIDKSGITLIMDDREYKLGPPSAGPATVE